MTEHKYKQIFIKTFALPSGFDVEHLEYQSILEWDSVGHMSLIAQIEDDFSVSMEIDDVIDFDSYSSGKEILKKYGILLDE